jgi:curved DNA-binding protein CbpA
VLARRFHPDVSPLPDAERRMAEINAAWATLGNPLRRRAWDAAHGVARVPPAPAQRHNGHGGAASGAGAASAAGSASGAEPERGTIGHEWTMPARPAGPPVWRRGPGGEGAAGPPPGRPSGSVLPFGRHVGWSLGEILRADRGYLQWLLERPEGAPYRNEIRALLDASRPGQAWSGPGEGTRRRGPFG